MHDIARPSLRVNIDGQMISCLQIRALSAELTKTDKLTLSSGVTATERTLQLLQAITDGVADTLGRISMKAGDVSQRVGDTPSYFSVVQLRDQVQRLMSTTARAKNIVTHLRAQTDAVSVRLAIQGSTCILDNVN